MNTKPASYKHDLGGGIYLEAFSVDPALTEKDLAMSLTLKDGTAQLDLDSINRDIHLVGSLNSFDDLEVRLNLERQFRVPEQLQAYRDAVGRASDTKGRYNGPVALFDGSVSIPLQLFQGGYYDFIATKLKAVPHDLVPDQYPAGRTVTELFDEWGISPEERARYLGFAHLLLTDGGTKLSFVQRAKGMAAAPDCISLFGSTPNPKFTLDFNFQQYCREHVQAEMEEEFALKGSEFHLAGLHLFDDKKEAPFAALEISTPLTTEALAARIYGKQDAIKEHPVLYSMPLEGVDTLLQRFPVFPSTVQVFRALIR